MFWLLVNRMNAHGRQTYIQAWHRYALRTVTITGMIAVVGSAIAPSWGQSPKPNAKPTVLNLENFEQRLVQRFEQRLGQGDTSETVQAEVILEGHKLFTVTETAPSTDSQPQSTPNKAQQRAQQIEQRLARFARSRFTSEKLKVTAKTNNKGLPGIYANGEFLTEVKPQDAEPGELQQRTREWAEIIYRALLRSNQERQPRFLVRQGVLASGVLMFIVAGSLSATYWQRRLKAEQKVIQNLTRQATASVLDATDSEPDQAVAVSVVQQQIKHRQQYNFKDIQQWILQVGKYAVWGFGSFKILGLFAYTRPLQPAMLSALKVPLKILGIGLGTYLVIRISFVVVNRFFAALKEREFLAPEMSQRLALRASTFSRVLQGATVVSLSVVGILASLSVIGVDLVPLLAGAGVIGLAISFASQSLIKDAINGFLILIEDQYGVGDVIAVENVAGFVEYMNLRITQLRDAEGRLITIPNSAISIVQNLSKDWSRVDLAIDVAYGTNPDAALTIIQSVATNIYRDPAWKEKMPEPPEVLGIDRLDHAGMQIRVWIKTRPLEQWSVAREFRRRLKLALDEQEVAIGVPQQSFWVKDSLTSLQQVQAPQSYPVESDGIAAKPAPPGQPSGDSKERH